MFWSLVCSKTDTVSATDLPDFVNTLRILITLRNSVRFQAPQVVLYVEFQGNFFFINRKSSIAQNQFENLPNLIASYLDKD